jgi:hypothetical protein
MNWNDLRSAWKNQPAPRPPDLDLSRLGESLEAKRRGLARRLFVRDCVEVAAGLLVATCFGSSLWQHGISHWPIAIATAIVLAVTVFFIRERIRAHRSRVGANAPLLTKLDADIAELDHQRQLLLSVGRWYVAPLMVAVMIVFGTFVYRGAARLHELRVQAFIGGYVAFCALLAWLITAMNRRVARKRIEPRLAELRQLRDDILSSQQS